MTRILALDLGTACGWARWDSPVALMTFGTFDLKPGQHSGAGMRYLKFRRELDKFVGLVDEVTYEIVRRHIGTAAAHVYGGLHGVLTAWCEENNIPYEGESVQAIKRAATGKGNASKEEMIAAAEALGFKPKTSDEADAIHLLRLRLSRSDNNSAAGRNVGAQAPVKGMKGRQLKPALLRSSEQDSIEPVVPLPEGRSKLAGAARLRAACR